jgi:hypothetical protein
MNALSLTNESPIRTFRVVPMGETGIPRHWHRNRPTIDEMDDECVLGYRHLLCTRLADFNRWR